uniref:LAGLIDADG homing endonuclease n=1 Tax=Chlamydomonas frankii TaxID=28455 RepID=Q8WL08_9CHLO|nr:putative protein [Chlamydomonas frankii]
MKKSISNSSLSDNMALGLFDSDGAVLLGADKATNKSGNSIKFKVTYFLGQSLSKKDTVAEFAKKFGANMLVDSRDAEFRVNQSSPEGQIFRQFLQKNEPKNLYRLRDFYISEEIIPLLSKRKKSRVELVTLARLVANKSRLIAKPGQSTATFLQLCLHISATDAEVSQGSQAADEILSKIEAKLQVKQEILAKTKLSNDYVLGAHFGDGSFYVGLSWKPTKLKPVERLRCEPEWSISGDNENYCQAFVRTLGGSTKSVDNLGQRKFVVSGLTKCLDVLPLFEKASWMPSYKQKQFKRWKDVLRLLEAQEHFTKKGIIRLVNLTYDLAEKGGRKYTKDQYLEWGLAWLNDPNRQKRSPRGKNSRKLSNQ